MNSQTFRYSVPTSRFRSTRAQYSPLRRQITSSALLGAHRTGLSGLELPGTTEAADPVLRWWDPHLVDRLQAPLTRYHE